ncbi:MAG: hypothetical protein FWG65_05020 [Turicibacter sp.]|nr:hypothetical protein [Turicibacter sp.]
MRIVGFLGPSGTFSHLAAQILVPDGDFLPMSSISDVFDGLSICDAGVVPVENSADGAISSTLDALVMEENVAITKMIMLPIQHSLLVLKDEPIKTVFGHPQILEHCRGYFKENFSEAELVATTSSQDAIFKLGSVKNAAMVGPKILASEHDLIVKAPDIQDSASNNTTFIQIEKRGATEPLPDCRVSIAFSMKSQPGALYGILGNLEKNNINLAKILNRPMPFSSSGEQIMFLDFEDYTVESAKSALSEIQSQVNFYKFLGSYPVEQA